MSLGFRAFDTCFRLREPVRWILIALTTIILLAAAGCCRCPEEKPPPNHSPRIDALFASANGKRIRLIRPDANVVVLARASDLDGDPLEYEWGLDDEGGAVTDAANGTVTWNTGSGDRGTLRLIVRDAKGGMAQAKISRSMETLRFGGRVVTADKQAVAGADVEVNGQRTRTDANGAFDLPLSDPDAASFLLTVRLAGFGLLSQVHPETIANSEWVLRRGTTVSVDPTQPVVVQDTSTSANCPGPPSTQIDWSRYPREQWPQIFDSAGQRLNIPYPTELQAARSMIGNGTQCAWGITARFGANSFVNAGGAPPPGNVNITVSTVDLYSPQSMPGDYTARDASGTQGYMESLGAGDVTVTDGDQVYALRSGAKASIEIPIDRLRLLMKTPLDPTVPFLSFDEASGVWLEEGTARLSEDRQTYIASLTHLSAFNMDLLKTNQSCVRIQSPLLPQSYQLQIMVPQGSSPPVVRTRAVDQTTVSTHVIYNLPNNTWIELLPVVTVSGNPVPIGTFVVNTGGPQTPSTPNLPAFDYQACNGNITLTDQVGPIALSYNGTGHVFGPRPMHPYTLTNAAGTDIYPVGGSELYLFGVFDTGAQLVVLSDLLVGGSPHPQSDASLLNVRPYLPNQATDPDLDVRIRIAGMDEINAATLWGPINPPGSASNAADVEVTGIRLRAADFPATLIGAPVTTRVVAEIDNTTILSRGPYAGTTVTGPDMQFYQPGSSSIPAPTIRLPLARFGTNTPSSSDNASRDERVFLRNVTFTNVTATSGTRTITDDQTVATPRQFMFDTGAPVTIINTSVATALGIPWTAAGGGTQDCWTDAGRPGNEGFQITSLEFKSFDFSGSGTYTIAPAEVCVDITATEVRTSYANPSPPPPGLFVDGVIGLNVLDHVPILVNLPDGYLGILAPPP